MRNPVALAEQITDRAPENRVLGNVTGTLLLIDGLTAKPKPSKEPIYRYWGTAWAAIGLARTLP